MTARRKWLQAALRAQQALTTDHAHRQLQAREALNLSQRAHAHAARAQEVGLTQWLQQRQRSPGTPQWDALHVGFQGFLDRQSQAAGQALEACRARLEDATLGLQRSHAVQSTLERLAEQAATAQRQAASARELRLQQEGWVLARTAATQAARPAAIGPAPNGHAPSPLQGGPAPALPLNTTSSPGD